MQRYAIIVVFAFAVGCTPATEDFESLDAYEQGRLQNAATQPEPAPEPPHFDARQLGKNALKTIYVAGAVVYVATVAAGYFVLFTIYHSGPFWR